MPFEVQHQVEIPVDVFLAAALKSLEVKDIPKRNPAPGEATHFQKLKWVFEVTEPGEFQGKTVHQETSAFLSDSPHNQFRNWAEALLGRPLDLGQVLNEQDLVGLQALIMCGKEADRREANKFWTRVVDVIPMDPIGSGGGAAMPNF